MHGTAGYDRARDGASCRHWVFVFFSDTAMPFDYPMLYVFDRQPEKIEVFSHEMWKFHFKSKTATVPRNDPSVRSRKTRQGYHARVEEGAARQDRKKLDFWASAAMAYPVGCKEYFFNIDGEAGRS